MSMLASVAYRPEPAASPSLAEDVYLGLSSPGQKSLPSKYLYDEVGSRLFEAICSLPEYGLTAADSRLLQGHAAQMLAPFGRGLQVVELGSGSGQKTRYLLEELARRQPVRYSPIEISAPALTRCAAELGGIGGLEIRPIHADYLEGLAEISRQRNGPVLLLFLGSTLGNFDPGPARQFLREVRAYLHAGDGLLLGLDLVKPVPTLKLAYDDPAGVTAAFNLNLLNRLNRELGANFDLHHWRHQIIYRARQRRIEMHLRSRRDQVVQVPGARLTARFRQGETIWTESSHKFRASEIPPLLEACGFRLRRQWTDVAWPFSESLSVAAG